MFSLNNVRPPILNKTLKKQLEETTHNNMKKYIYNSKTNLKTNLDINGQQLTKINPNEIYFVIPFVSLFSFLAGFYFFKYKNF